MLGLWGAGRMPAVAGRRSTGWVWLCHCLGAYRAGVLDHQEMAAHGLPRARAASDTPRRCRIFVQYARPHMISAAPHQPASPHHDPGVLHSPTNPSIAQVHSPAPTRSHSPHPQTSNQVPTKRRLSPRQPRPRAPLHPITSPDCTPCSIDTTRLKKGSAGSRTSFSWVSQIF